MSALFAAAARDVTTLESARATGRSDDGVTLGTGGDGELAEHAPSRRFIRVTSEHAADCLEEREAVELLAAVELGEERPARLEPAAGAERDGRVKADGRVDVGEERHERVV